MDTMSTHTITSTDGTVLACDRVGRGPALVLVDGAFCSRGFGPTPKLAPLLADQFTVFAYDRRGRGDSGDATPYSIEREIEDLQAVLGAAGGSASVVGFSSGAILALMAAAAGSPIDRLVAWEPPLVTDQPGGHQPPPDAVDTLAALIATDRRDQAVRYYFTQVMGAPAVAYYLIRLRSLWPKMRAVAPSLPYDAAVFTTGAAHPMAWLAGSPYPSPSPAPRAPPPSRVVPGRSPTPCPVRSTGSFPANPTTSRLRSSPL
jgi:pimeloyl-ACP methyl ester carboxylesterase